MKWMVAYTIYLFMSRNIGLVLEIISKFPMILIFLVGATL